MLFANKYIGKWASKFYENCALAASCRMEEPIKSLNKPLKKQKSVQISVCTCAILT
jgi:hypothetical protein